MKSAKLKIVKNATQLSLSNGVVTSTFKFSRGHWQFVGTKFCMIEMGLLSYNRAHIELIGLSATYSGRSDAIRDCVKLLKLHMVMLKV